MKLLFSTIAAALSLGSIAAAECATDAEVAGFVSDYLAAAPARALVPDGTMEDALCTQAKVSAALVSHMGPVIGYKTGLTSKPAQERFGVTEPVQGILYRDMMLPDGAEVPAKWGSRPVFEADLILVIGSAAINDTTTSAEAMAYISAVHPFIELPDLTYAEDQPITGVTLTAMGVAPKLGVLGAAIPVDDAAQWHQVLGEMQVTLTAADGEVLAKVPGAAVLGHPVNSVLWLMSKGITMKPGDLVSVGSFGPLFPPVKAKGGAMVAYEGLPGNPTVSVKFK
jgi:2-oxo-hept-3-ene-1,7-dioate hydratase